MWMLASVLLLSAFSSVGTSKKEEILNLVTRLEDLIQNLEFSPSPETSQAPAEQKSPPKTATRPPGTANFVKPIKVFNSANRTYCDNAVCPDIYCNLTEIANTVRLLKAVHLPKIYSLCNGSIKAFVSMQKYTAEKSVASCCNVNCTLQSLNSPEIISCFKDLIKADFKQKGIFWTSGIYSKECDAYVWCPEKEIISINGPQKWRQGFPNRTQGDCIAVQTGQEKQEENGLFNLKCSFQISHMCYGSPDVVTQS